VNTIIRALSLGSGIMIGVALLGYGVGLALNVEWAILAVIGLAIAALLTLSNMFPGGTDSGPAYHPVSSGFQEMSTQEVASAEMRYDQRSAEDFPESVSPRLHYLLMAAPPGLAVLVLFVSMWV
jgi:hypothetical protein